MEAATARRTEARMGEWSKDRLDEFAVGVDERFDRAEEKTAERFDRVGEEFDRVGERFGDVDRRFREADRRFDHLDHELGRVNDRLDDLVKVLIAGFVGFTGAVMAGFGALVVLFATQF
jgi:hypothetical protein